MTQNKIEDSLNIIIFDLYNLPPQNKEELLKKLNKACELLNLIEKKGIFNIIVCAKACEWLLDAVLTFKQTHDVLNDDEINNYMLIMIESLLIYIKVAIVLNKNADELPQKLKQYISSCALEEELNKKSALFFDLYTIKKWGIFNTKTQINSVDFLTKEAETMIKKM